MEELPPAPTCDDVAEHGAPCTAGRASVEEESASEALARHWSLCGAGASSCTQAISSDHGRSTPTLECVSTLRRVIGIERFLAYCPETGYREGTTSTRHARRRGRTDSASEQHAYVKHGFAQCYGRWGCQLGWRTQPDDGLHFRRRPLGWVA